MYCLDVQCSTPQTAYRFYLYTWINVTWSPSIVLNGGRYGASTVVTPTSTLYLCHSSINVLLTWIYRSYFNWFSKLLDPALVTDLQYETMFNIQYRYGTYFLGTGTWCYKAARWKVSVLKGLCLTKNKRGQKWYQSIALSLSFYRKKISQIFVQPPSCYLHKTAQRHIIECCELF